MKKLLQFIAFTVITTSINAQAYTASFNSASASAYTDLTGATIATSSTINIPFSFKFYGSYYTSFEIDSSGFLNFNSPDSYSGFGADFIYTASTISYKLEGTTMGSRIFKLQIKDAVFKNDPSSTVNYQVWLFETSNIIQTVMGSSSRSINATTAYCNGQGPAIGIFATDLSQTSGFYSYFFEGALPATTSNASWISSGFPPCRPEIAGTPSSSETFTFTPATIGVNEQDKDLSISIFPNPAKDLLHLNMKGQKNAILNIYSVSGMLVFSKSGINTDNNKIDISSLQNGVYMVEIINGENTVNKRIVKI